MDSGSGRILGSGEMAERVRGYDWGPTALGPVEGWSREMITMVNLTLASSSPARVMWGTELILIYNDAYRPIPGPRHPWALGKPAREVYGESWPVVGPLLEQAMATGETLFYEGLRMLLPAAEGTREAYLNYSFIPIYEPGSEAGEAGKVAGLFGTLHEVTGEVVALRKLAESEARALRILQSIGDAVIVTDENALITDMNHVAETMTGWMLGEARGVELSTVFRIVDEEKREPVESPAEKVRRLGTIVGLANHTILIRKDGTEVPIDDSGAPIWDEEAKLSGIVLVFRDITERKMAEKVAQRERAKVLEAMRQAPVFFALLEGPEHVFTMVNANYVSLVGGRDVMHLPVREALPEVAAQGYIEVLDKVYEGERFVGYGQPYTPVVDGRAGELRYVDFVYEPLREADGRVAGIIVCGIDVTDRRKSQEAMERQAAIVD
jgi:PAS domain S-box-containing protein